MKDDAGSVTQVTIVGTIDASETKGGTLTHLMDATDINSAFVAVHIEGPNGADVIRCITIDGDGIRIYDDNSDDDSIVQFISHNSKLK